MTMRLAVVSALAALSTASAAYAEPTKGGIINVATVGEPPTLDAMVTSTDLVGMISQHIFETLFTFDKNWNVAPLLAESLPEVSDDGTVYTIKLRQGVVFHDDTQFDAADVVASLDRWMKLAGRGKQIAPTVKQIEAVDQSTIRITLTKPYSALPALLAFNNSAAIMLPSEKQADPMVEVIGTGPYQLKERKPDQYIQLTRFDKYKPRAEEGSGYAGARIAYLDEIRFVPAPDASTRLEGAIAGQFAYTDSLPVEQMGRLADSKSEAVLLQNSGWLMMRMNAKQGVLADVKVRKAVQAALSESDMLAAAFGDPKFFAVEGAMYPEGYQWHSNVGVEGNYDVGDADAAKKLLTDAGLTTPTPLRILTSRQYEFHYKMALVAAEYLKLAGFDVKMEVVDWATLTQRILNPELWDIFITHSPFLAEPALINIFSPTAVGWWSTPEIADAMTALTGTADPAKRVAAFGTVQSLIMEQAPIIKVGNFSALSAKAPGLKGFWPSPWASFWNVSLEK
ncbi:ABC transporter substrate-binding protein (plasmid) [Aminobacter sp. BA135]|uniref:ABC transporter substrate-binding protein n=1 Tax=Aminobacter sp. BA135 TaxID=537596 RepID=UPI003D79C6C5